MKTRESRDRYNLYRRESRRKEKASLNLKCLHCGKDIPLERRSLKFCCTECKSRYHTMKIVEKCKVEGYPKVSRKRKDKFNEERRKLRREEYLFKEHKCKECGTTLTLEHYPRTEFCSNKCNIKFHARSVNRFRVKEEKKEPEIRPQTTLIRVDSRTWIQSIRGDQEAEKFAEILRKKKELELESLKKAPKQAVIIKDI